MQWLQRSLCSAITAVCAVLGTQKLCEIGYGCSVRHPRLPVKRQAFLVYVSLVLAGSFCHCGSELSVVADLACLHIALLSCSCEAAVFVGLEAQLLLLSHFMLCPGLQSHIAVPAVGSIGGCLKSLFETGYSSEKTHLLLSHICFGNYWGNEPGWPHIST